MYHDTSKQQQIVDWTKHQHGAYSIAGHVQQQKLEQMQRENAANKEFWDNHNKKMQSAWQSTTTSTGSSGGTSAGSGGAGGLVVVLLVVIFAVMYFAAG